MTSSYRQLAVVTNCAVLSLITGCSKQPPVVPLSAPPITTVSESGIHRSDELQTDFLGGEDPVPSVGKQSRGKPQRGDIKIDFPSADVHVVAKAVLGDILKTPYTIAPGTSALVSLVTPAPIARSAIFPAFEAALKNAGLAMVDQNGGYKIMTISAAQSEGVTTGDVSGYSNEVIKLNYINAEELKKLLDSVVPGVALRADSGSNSIAIAGTTGQRSSAHDLIKQFDVDWLRSMSFAFYTPRRTDSRLIVPELEKLINAADSPTRGLVRLIAMDKLNGIIAVSQQRHYLQDVARWIDVLDREGTSNEVHFYVYRVQNGRSKDLVKTLNGAFGGGGGSSSASDSPDPFASETTSNNTKNTLTPIRGPDLTRQQTSTDTANATSRGVGAHISSDEVNNAVVVYATPHDYAIVEDALRKLDVPPAQVLIEAAITEVTLTNELQYGVQWNWQSGSNTATYAQGSNATPKPILPGLSYSFVGTSIQAALNALQQHTNINVVSAPKLVVLNNQTAALQVGDQVPILTQQLQSGTGTGTGTTGATVANSVEYRDTGIILKITPRVNEGGLVLLDIAQEVSQVKSTTASGISSPTISTRRISSSVAVQDGQVIALGGLFQDSKSYGRNGIPGLSRIPLIGGLFGTTDNTQNRTELIVLIKPHVLRTADDSRAITEELRAKLQTLEPFKTQGKIP